VIISTTSKGSLVAGDECVVGVPGGAPHECVLLILAGIRCQSDLMSSSKTVVAIMTKYSGERRTARPPNNGGTGTVVGVVAFLLQGVKFSVRKPGPGLGALGFRPSSFETAWFFGRT